MKFLVFFVYVIGVCIAVPFVIASSFTAGFLSALDCIEISNPYHVDDGKNDFRINFKIGPFIYEKTLKKYEK